VATTVFVAVLMTETVLLPPSLIASHAVTQFEHISMGRTAA
jgi:hypothetical protein